MINPVSGIYSVSLGLLTDLYQLTMAQGYFHQGMQSQEGVFTLFFRKNPFKSGFTIACGLENAVDYLNHFRFTKEDLEYLASLKGKKGSRLFDQAFLDYLADIRFTCQVDAVEEGQVVFPQEPLLRVKGPMIQCQLLETPLLNLLNFQTLIATKAARLFLAAEGKPILEFGLRRAQGIDGALSASRAAYIGGCSSTSNVLAGKLYGIPVSGTHAHSWIMSFNDEKQAFTAYAASFPEDSIFLVDTYNTLEGVKNAIEVGIKMKKEGRQLSGIRIDSGDLAYLSQQARMLLDEAGLQDVKIVASNDLDENIMASLNNQDARIDLWGVGTKLVTGYDQPALGGVYKLSAIRGQNGEWSSRIKLSEQVIKINNPGLQQVRRFRNRDGFYADMIFNEWKSPDQDKPLTIIDPADPTRRKQLNRADFEQEDLLITVFRDGRQVYQLPSLEMIREKVQQNLKMLHPGVRRFINPHLYPVGLEENYYREKMELVMQLRKLNT